jgi:hypothetical protein
MSNNNESEITPEELELLNMRHDQYALYIGESFKDAKEIAPIHLSKGANDITAEMLSDLEEFDRLVIIGINDKDGESNE